jgi:L-lactate permease
VIWPHVYDPLGSPLASTLVATLPPVALGAVGTPIITLAKVTGLD